MNGATSSGKTTLAKALQNALKDPFLHLGIDKLIDWMPEKVNNLAGTDEVPGFYWESSSDSLETPHFHIRTGFFAEKVISCLKDLVKLLANSGFNIILEDVALKPNEVTKWRKELKGYSTLYVGVQAPLEVLEEREKSRKNRKIGSARGQYFHIHKDVDYDLILNTHTHSTKSNVSMIQNALIPKA